MTSAKHTHTHAHSCATVHGTSLSLPLSSLMKEVHHPHFETSAQRRATARQMARMRASRIIRRYFGPGFWRTERKGARGRSRNSLRQRIMKGFRRLSDETCPGNMASPAGNTRHWSQSSVDSTHARPAWPRPSSAFTLARAPVCTNVEARNVITL